MRKFTSKIKRKKKINVYLLFWCSILITLSPEIDVVCCCWCPKGGGSSCGISVCGTRCHNEAAMPDESGEEASLVLGTSECCRNKVPDDDDC